MLAGLLVAEAHAVTSTCPRLPERQSEVVDEASRLTADERTILVEAIARHRNATGFEINVLTVPTLCGESIEAFSQRIAREWNIGRAKFDDGALVVLSTGDQQIHVWMGQGLLMHIPESRISDLVKLNFIPELRKGHIGSGLISGIAAVAAESRSVKTAVTVPEVYRYFYALALFSAQFVFFALPILFGFARLTGIKFVILSRSIRLIRYRADESARRPALQLLRAAVKGVALAPFSKLRNSIYAAHVPDQDGLKILDFASNPTAIAVWIPGTWTYPFENQRKSKLAHFAAFLSRRMSVPGVEYRDAVVRQKLNERHPGALICRFAWFATNSYSARLKAAGELQKRLVTLLRSTGPVPIFLIGHSHGGSVAQQVAETWDQPSEVHVATIGTPFIKICKRTEVADEVPKSSIDKAASHAAVTLYTLPTLLAIFAVWWVCSNMLGSRLGTFSWIPGADHWRLLPRPNLETLEFATGAVMAWALVNIVYAVTRTLVRRILHGQRAKMPLVNKSLVRPNILSMRIAQDELLNVMLGAARVHRLRLAACVFQQREAVDFSERKIALNLAWTITLWVVCSYITPFAYSSFVRVVGSFAATLPEEQLAFVAYLCVISSAAALACLMRFRLAIASGAIAAEVLWDIVVPFANLLTFAQSRLAGVPMALLAAGYVRIDDRPGSSPAFIIPATEITTSVGPQHRHSASAIEPGVWEQLRMFPNTSPARND